MEPIDDLAEAIMVSLIMRYEQREEYWESYSFLDWVRLMSRAWCKLDFMVDSDSQEHSKKRFESLWGAAMDNDLDAMQARCDAATKGDPCLNGRWDVVQDKNGFFFLGISIGDITLGGTVVRLDRKEDITFAGHARQDVPNLIAEVRALRTYEEWYKRGVECADGFNEIDPKKPTTTHIVDKICAIGWKLERLQKEHKKLIAERDRYKAEAIQAVNGLDKLVADYGSTKGSVIGNAYFIRGHLGNIVTREEVDAANALGGSDD